MLLAFCYLLLIRNTTKEKQQMPTTTVTVHSTIEAISCPDCATSHNIEVFSFCGACEVHVCMHSDCPCPISPEDEAEWVLG